MILNPSYVNQGFLISMSRPIQVICSVENFLEKLKSANKYLTNHSIFVSIICTTFDASVSAEDMKRIDASHDDDDVCEDDEHQFAIRVISLRDNHTERMLTSVCESEPICMSPWLLSDQRNLCTEVQGVHLD